MESFDFEAIGTKWSIATPSALDEGEKKAILEEISSFESRFSRFLDGSEANAYREALPGTYEISEDFARMLEQAQELKALTGGRFDPGLGFLLEEAGYDKEYRFVPGDVESITLSAWSLSGQELSIDGPIVFDIGGIGKGFCIDQVSFLLEGMGQSAHLIDAGGDMFATEKADGSGFRVALEWPGKPDTAFSVVELRNQGLAVSDTFRRRWGKWHHIVDPEERQPVSEVVGASALAKSAFDADCMTSVLFQLPKDRFPEAAALLGSEYAVFHADEGVSLSPGWPGELF